MERHGGGQSSSRQISAKPDLRPRVRGGSSDSSGPNDDGSRPPYSFPQLIVQAITSAKNKQLTLSEIYSYIAINYPYYKIDDKGWQDSIISNLESNSYFMKVARSQRRSDYGSYWRIVPKFEAKVTKEAFIKKRKRGVPCSRASIGLFPRIYIKRSAATSSSHVGNSESMGHRDASTSQPIHEVGGDTSSEDEHSAFGDTEELSSSSGGQHGPARVITQHIYNYGNIYIQ